MHSLLLTPSPVQQFRRVSQEPLRLEVPLHEEWWLISVGRACISPDECSRLLNPFSVAWLPAGRTHTLSPIVEDVPIELQVVVRPDGDARGRGHLEPLVTSWLESVLSSQQFATQRLMRTRR